MSTEEAIQVTRGSEFANIGSARWTQLWKKVFVEYQQVSLSKVLVDSSKTSGGQARLKLLLTEFRPEVDITVLHLVRAPEHVLSSLLKGSNSDLARGLKPGLVKRWSTASRGALGWIRANRLAEACSRQRVVVFFEEYLTDPAVVEDTLKQLDFAVGPPAHDDYHVIGGNRHIKNTQGGTKSRPDLAVRRNHMPIAGRILLAGMRRGYSNYHRLPQ